MTDEDRVLMREFIEAAASLQGLDSYVLRQTAELMHEAARRAEDAAEKLQSAARRAEDAALQADQAARRLQR